MAPRFTYMIALVSNWSTKYYGAMKLVIVHVHNRLCKYLDRLGVVEQEIYLCWKNMFRSRCQAICPAVRHWRFDCSSEKSDTVVINWDEISCFLMLLIHTHHLKPVVSPELAYTFWQELNELLYCFYRITSFLWRGGGVLYYFMDMMGLHHWYYRLK